MPSGVYTWSQTAATNASADSTINWAEGQAPSSVNDSARAMMASVAKWRDDIGSNLQTGGTSTAYTITSNSVYPSQALMNDATLSILMHTTNGANPTLNVDGLGAAALVIDGTGQAVPTGSLVSGSVYTATYYSFPNQWRLKNFYQLPFMVPIGGMIDYFGSSSPASNFVLPYGQAISRSTYATLFALFSTTFGAGDGSTTFNIPDLRGRVVAGKDDMGGAAASRLTSSYFGSAATNLGAVGGLESHNLTTPQLAAHTHANSLTDPGHVHTNPGSSAANTGNGPAFAGNSSGAGTFSTASATTGVTLTNASAGSGAAHNNTQPTIIANKLLRVI